jgi:hypothetical protein
MDNTLFTEEDAAFLEEIMNRLADDTQDIETIITEAFDKFKDRNFDSYNRTLYDLAWKAKLEDVEDKDRVRIFLDHVGQRNEFYRKSLFSIYVNILVKLKREDILYSELNYYKKVNGENKHTYLTELYLLLKDGFEQNADRIIELTNLIKPRG